jgi:hypothetical protein
MPALRPQDFGLLLFGLLLSVFFAGGLVRRRALELSGVVVSSETKCHQPQNNRWVSTYVLRLPSGTEVTYRAASDDESLQRRLPVGTVLEKHAGVVSYRVNGVPVNDFPVIAYTIFIGAGIVLVFGSTTYLVRHRRARP